MWFWARGAHAVSDWWECERCKIKREVSPAGELPAIEHTQLTGHDTTLYHQSERSFFAVGATPPVSEAVQKFAQPI